ncbi:5'-3' exoribonuclease pacman isoform X2 [Tachypleus tridentatus]|uniref:5'-3' exoribonuclease pacman isoform X2 n=1 Tax=Tachypleus tridentatus TaxID=6853 RepID=UPI003FCFCAB8
MGVPKFYRWISERYPCLSEVVKEYQIPEFDNLYLDMNGIIHTCSHPNDEDPHFRMSEEKIFEDIFHYIEFLFQMIKPKKVFFMAVDGVAPRAKMNQQRSRRFRSAKEAELLEKKAQERGEVLPTEARFDSNCITPGTEFMVRLHKQLKYFVSMKISTDKRWRGISVYLSGHETPGEGEHKIMEFIRYEKSQPGYDANTRHCLYGLDADLIMLGLCSHEPHFSLLREEVTFTGKKSQRKISTPEETTFHLLHLSLMREYLDFEFSALKKSLPFEYNLENIIDDWVLMSFLVGNDFIPNLPQLHIHHDALPTLYHAYIEVLPSLNGYINEEGYLNLDRFEKYLRRLSEFDYKAFSDTYADLKFLESKRNQREENDKNYNKSSSSISPKKKSSETSFAALDDQDDTLVLSKSKVTSHKLLDLDLGEEYDDDDDETSEEMFELEFKQHKRDYYMNKLDYETVTAEVLKDQAHGYVRAIQWNLHYYYNGVASWSWFYPHHYAPYISDLRDFSNLNLEYDLGKPFLPFQQLAAVLPEGSKDLLPKAYQGLMCNENSPLKEFYPSEFKTDLNGKLQEWEAVILIPFIDEKKLLSSMEPLEELLTVEEKQRNRHGPHLLYTYKEKSFGTYLSSLPGHFPDIDDNHAHCQEIHEDSFRIPANKIKKGLCDGVRLDVYIHGFPTFRHIEHEVKLSNEKVKVFQMVSRNDNMIVSIKRHISQSLKEVAAEFCDQCIYVSWPHLEEAKVLSVSDGHIRYSLSDGKGERGQLVKNEMSDDEISVWRKQAYSVSEYYFERLGILTGNVKILLHVAKLTGRKYICEPSGKVTLEKQWSPNACPFPLQCVVKDLEVQAQNFQQFTSVEDMFTTGTLCFMLGHPHYGCMGEVIERNFARDKGRLRIKFSVCQDPDLKDVIRNKKNLMTDHYMTGFQVAQKMGISSLLLSKMTGTVFVQTNSMESMSANKTNIGLNLKFNKRNEEIPGYSKKINNIWLYSDKAVEVMKEYIEKFPILFERIVSCIQQDIIHVSDLFPEENGRDLIHQISAWLKSLPCSKVERQKCGAEVLDEPVVKAIEEIVDKFQDNSSEKLKHIVMQVKPYLLYRPFYCHGWSVPDPNSNYMLFDRVVNVREGYAVPLGLRGTVIGIHEGDKTTNTMYDVVFDKSFPGGTEIRCSATRRYRLQAAALINLSHGNRLKMNKKNSFLQSFKNVQESMFDADLNEKPMREDWKEKKKNYKFQREGNFDSFYKCKTPQEIHHPSTQTIEQSIPLKYHHALSPSSDSISCYTGQNMQHQHLQTSHCSSTRQPPFYSHIYDYTLDTSQPSFSPVTRDSRTQSGVPVDFVTPVLAKPQSTKIDYRDTVGYQRVSSGSRESQNAELKQEMENVHQNLQFLSMWEGLKNTAVDQSSSQATHLQSPVDNSVRPNYGQPVAVEELFRGARDALHNKPNATDSSHGQYSQKKSEIQKEKSTSAVRELLDFISRNMGGRMPEYRYSMVGPMQLYQAVVLLPNGLQFFSTPAATQHEASESAAEEAIVYLDEISRKSSFAFLSRTNNNSKNPASSSAQRRPTSTSIILSICFWSTVFTETS